jgi:biotin-(acetyl-CoA carboxylase) ligase
MNDIPMAKLILLPIGVGVLVAETLDKYVSVSRDDCSVTPSSRHSLVEVKWPNDVLLGEQKVAGTLIENCRAENGVYWLLIGIGVNLESYPAVIPPEREDVTLGSTPRMATCLKEHIAENTAVPSPVEFGVNLSRKINQMVRTGELANDDDYSTRSFSSGPLIERWKTFANFGKQYVIRTTGERVKILGIEKDGQLRVIDDNGMERLLVSDYFL